MEPISSLFAITLFGIPFFALLWRYSALPEIEWDHILMGALFFLGARGIEVWSSAFSGDPRIGSLLASFFMAWAAVFDIVGAALVVEGALRNAYEIYEK